MKKLCASNPLIMKSKNKTKHIKRKLYYLIKAKWETVSSHIRQLNSNASKGKKEIQLLTGEFNFI